jgi:ATP-dependent helicase/nuclease subunit A
MNTSSTTLPITVISAGAGSGKTYTLTQRMVDMLQRGVRPEGIVATTFTQKAAAELQDRVRVRLLEQGMTTEANQLGAALIGTVHSIGVKLLQRFAFEIGVSPLVEVIAEGDGQLLFNQSLSQVLSNERIERMNLLADRLGLTKRDFGDPFDWRRPIRQLTDLARANNFGPEVLQLSKQRSWQTFEAMLPPIGDTDEVRWHNRLITSLEQSVAALRAQEADTTKVTRDAAEALQKIANDLRWRGELYWFEWVKISKINPGAKSRELVADLHELARSHDQHPRFRADIRAFGELVFDIAADALDEYERYKKKRGLIDYTDMETYVSHLLRLPEVQKTLATEIDLLLVDEFQDTSPIQLDIFLQLSRLARHSIWVGDPKQSIYGFRGADPALMQAIVEATGGIRDENILKKSWRSRPDLVECANAIFTRAFDRMPREQVVLEPAWHPQTGQDIGPALVHWHFQPAEDARRPHGAPWTENCVASQIRDFLIEKTPIFNKKRNATQPAQAGDVAVLCRDNKACQSIADALHRVGIKASIARAGLLHTPEIRLVVAYLRLLVNPNDRLSQAEIRLISGDTTLEALLHEPADAAWVSPLLRIAYEGLSAAEIVQQLVAELDLRRLVARLGYPAQRLDNLECLRRYALEYESACDRIHSAATVGGFLLWLDQLAENQQDMQGSGESPDAVRVLTYHRSKGLEYPVTVLFNLDQRLRESVWGFNLIPDRAPDLDDILGGRWIRYWVSPYADQEKGTRLTETLQASEAFAVATRQALDEEARLLYVGITRARDYLVLPTTGRGTAWLNRVFSHGNADTPTLDPESDETPFYTADQRVLTCTLRSVILPKDLEETAPEANSTAFHPASVGRNQHRAYRIDPLLPPNGSSALQPLGEPLAFATWLEYRGEYQPALGTCLRDVLTAQIGELPTDRLNALIIKQLNTRSLDESLSSVRVAVHVASFFSFLKKHFNPQKIHYAVPLRYESAGQILELQADLLLDLADGSRVVLHLVPFAEGMKKWRSAALAVGSPLAWVQHILRTERPDAAVQVWVVFVVEGQLVRMG